jgi:tetratricopeptide (TPR) repeat protein
LVCAVAALGALGSFGTTASFATEEKDEVSLPALPPSNTAAAPKGPEKAAPKFRLPLQQFLVQKEKEVEGAWQRVMDRLDGILARTPKENPDYPDYLYRKANLYEERAQFFFNRGMRRDDNRPDEPAARAAHEKEKAADLAVSRQARLDALKVWAQIYKGFPSYAHADQALYNLGSNLTRLDQGKKALRFFTELIKRFPDSKLVPDAFLAIGEYYFDNNEMATALKAYDRVAFFKESTLYGFAIYKQAWCHYNLSDYKTSMKRFIEVIRYSEGGKEDRNKLDLLSEAKREIILAYSHAAPAEHAKDFFPKVVKNEGETYWEWVEPRLADTYFSQGKHNDAIHLYKSLITKVRGTAKAVTYQVKVVRAQIAIGTGRVDGRSLVSKEVFELIREYKAVQGGKATDREEARNAVEAIVRELALTFHHDAIKLKSKSVYALAADMYKAYVEAFGDDPQHGPNTKFFLGELYYTLERWEEAGLQYLAVGQQKTKTQYRPQALYGAIVALSKALKSANISGGQETLKREGKVPTPEAIPPLELKLAEACDLFLADLPADKADKAADVHYRMARIYYEHYHFKEAAARFEAFIEKYPDHRLTSFAGHALLDSLNALGEFDKLARWGKRLLKTTAISAGTGKQKEDLRAELEDVTQGATLKSIEQLTSQNKHKEAAAAYDDFLRRYPKNPYLDKVLHNAATAFERVAQPERAVELRDRLVRSFPDSPLAAEAMYSIGRSYHNQGIYSLAAAYYEALSQVHGAYKGADVALNAAALFREGGGEFDKALRNLKDWIARYGKERRGAAVADKYFRMGVLLQRRGEWSKVRTHFERFLRDFPATPDQKLQALWEIARASQQLGGGRNDKRLARLYQRVVDAWSDLSTEQKASLGKGRDAVAQARFAQAEVLFRAFQNMKLSNPRKIKKQLRAKAAALLEAKNAFYDVIHYKQAEWAIAAYSRTGEIYQGFAKALIESPPPKKLPERLQQVYKEQLETESAKVEKTAREAYIKCLEASRELKVYTSWTRLAEKQLAVLLPKDYAESNEIKVQPEFAFDPAPPAKDPREAMEAYQKVLAMDPTNAEAMNAMGLLVRREGGTKWQEAVSWFRRVLTVDPRNVDAYRNLAWTYYRVGKYDLAHLVSLNAETTIGKPDAGILNNWGLIQLRRDKLAQAVAAFKRAIDVNPNFAPPRLNFAALAVNYSDYATAEREFREALRVDASSAMGQMGLALGLRGAGKAQDALREYERALTLDGQNPLIHFNLGILFQEFLDKPQQAIASFERFLELGRDLEARHRQDAETRIKNLRQQLDVMKKGKT